MHHRQRLVRVQRTLAQSRKVLTAAGDSHILQPAQKFPRICHRGLCVLRGRARSQYPQRCIEAQVQYRSEIHVEAQGSNFAADQLPVGATKCVLPRPHNLAHAGRRTNRIFQPVHRAALHVHAAEQRYLRRFLRRLQQSVRLPRRLNIARK